MATTSIPKTFLLIDDDIDDTDLFFETVNTIGIHINCKNAKNGKEAIDYLKETEQLPDLIFLDINMPLMGGFECLKTLKRQDKLKHIPVIMYSTSSDSHDIQMAQKSGALGFYTKPHSFKEIYEFFEFIIKNVDGNLKSAILKHERFNLFNKKN